MFRRTLHIIIVIIIYLTIMTSCGKKSTEPAEQCATPVFSPTGGQYAEAQTVSITCTTTGTTIVYTVDGSDPTSGSTVYTNPIQIITTTTIKAKSFKSGWINSQIASVTYTILQGFVLVPGGTFTMGNTLGEGYSDELPTHTVTLSSFYIGKYEVTQSEWQATMGSIPASDYGEGANYPVYYVSWYAIIKYCNLRSMAEGLTPVYTINDSTNPTDWGSVPTNSNASWDAAICNWSAHGYRLPTEAEWEYAARGGTTTPDYVYAGSDESNTVAWYGSNSGFTTHTVGTKAPNGLGIYDMSGNVFEWCWDWYGSYSSAAQNNPTGPVSGSERLLRGGNWLDGEYYSRVSDRGSHSPLSSYISQGLRIVRAN